MDSLRRTRGLDRREAKMATLRSTPTLQAKPAVRDLGCLHLCFSCSPLFAEAHFLTSFSMVLPEHWPAGVGLQNQERKRRAGTGREARTYVALLSLHFDSSNLLICTGWAEIMTCSYLAQLMVFFTYIFPFRLIWIQITLSKFYVQIVVSETFAVHHLGLNRHKHSFFIN